MTAQDALSAPPAAVPQPRTAPAVGAAPGEGAGLGLRDPGEAVPPPAAYAAADAAGVENLLRCWTRETGAAPGSDGSLRIPLTATGCVLLAPVRYWSPTGAHCFGPAVIETGAGPAGGPFGGRPTGEGEVAAGRAAGGQGEVGEAAARPADRACAARSGTPSDAPDAPLSPADRASAARTGTPVDAVTLAALLAREAATALRAGEFAPGAGDAAPTQAGARCAVASACAAHTADARTAGPGHIAQAAAADQADLVARVADSVRRTAVFVADRRARPAAPPGTPPFLAAEQALVLGHPAHPAPKSREGLSDAETPAYSPETRGAFAPHWMAVDRSVLATDSGWREKGRPVAAEELTARLAGPGLRLPAGFAALPVHPWQARALRERPRVRSLMNAGLLRDLGPLGDVWHPTSSVRTLYQPGAPAMLKLSLAVRITNSRRENLRKELLRGAEVNRLLRGPVGRRWHAECPGFDIVRDPAWLAVDGPSGETLTGLDVVLRHVPFAPGDAVGCLAGLVAAGPQGEWRSRLAELTFRLAARTGRKPAAVATEWFLRYLHAVVRPVLRLDGQAGIALEAHQQNTLVALDPLGWPRGGWFRDNQGYYFRASRRAALDHALPGIGTASDTFVDDAVADERFAYYLGVNNVLGLIGAFGAQRLADEEVLLAAFRRFLAAQATAPDASALPARLLTSPTLRCKANLLTRLHGLDELVGPVDTQSVYVTVTNPVAVPTA